MLFTHVVLLLSATSIALAAAIADSNSFHCPDGSKGTILNSTIVDGKPLTKWSCKMTENARRDAVGFPDASLAKKDTGIDLCGAPCTTYCINNPSSGGPNPNDCQALANQDVNDGNIYIPAGNVVNWSYGSCNVEMTTPPNTDDDISYCFSDWSPIVTYVAWNCQAAEGASGGTCQFYGNTLTSYIKVATV